MKISRDLIEESPWGNIHIIQVKLKYYFNLPYWSEPNTELHFIFL